jgi:hypothetical protein
VKKQEKYIEWVIEDLLRDTKLKIMDLTGFEGGYELSVSLSQLSFLVTGDSDEWWAPLNKDNTEVLTESTYATGLMEHYSINEEEFRFIWDEFERRLYRKGDELFDLFKKKIKWRA